MLEEIAGDSEKMSFCGAISYGVLLLLQILPLGRCFNHWVVTEDGKIEHQVRESRVALRGGGGACHTQGISHLRCLAELNVQA